MLEDLYKSENSISRLRQKPFAEHLEGIAGKLHQIGYRRKYGQRILWKLGEFNELARTSGIQDTHEIDEALIQGFLDQHNGTERILASAAMGHFQAYLCEEGIDPIATHVVSDTSIEEVLQDYDKHLRDVRGLSMPSRDAARRHGLKFLTWLKQRHGDAFFECLNGVDVLDFINESLGTPPRGSRPNSFCSQIRVFLRYLRWRELIHTDLERVVPKLKSYRLSRVPRHLPWEDVRKLIDSVDLSTPVGLRDRAVLLLIGTTGVRNKEVRCLKLEDIQWRTAEIRLRRTKGGRERVVPLVQEAGAAIADYLLHGRPQHGAREVFLRHFTPKGPILSAHGVGNIIKKHLRRAGIRASSQGAYLLRHSLASRMVNQAVPIKHIADVLGHVSIDTTAIYTKVATANLAAAALPFPGGGR